MTITASHIFKNSYKFSSINLLSKILNFPVAIVLATVLGPSNFGTLAIAGLYLTYAGWITLNAMSAACREMPVLIRNKEIDKAHEIQNLSISLDSLIYLAVFVGLIIISLKIENVVLRNLLLLLSSAYILEKVLSFLGAINYSYLDFSLAAKGQLIKSISNPVFSIGLVYLIGIYTPPFVSIIIIIITSLYYLKKKSYSIKFLYKKTEYIRLAKIGFAINLTSILGSLFANTADRTIIAKLLSTVDLGLYVFAYNLYYNVAELFRDFGRVLQPTIWSYSENAPNTQQGFSSLIDIAIYISIASTIVIGISQIFFICLTNILIPKFIGSQRIFLILSSYIFWEALSIFPYLILASSRVNKLNFINYMYGSILLVNILLDLLVVKLGYGIWGIAFVTTFAQFILTSIFYISSRKYMFSKEIDFLNFISRILAPYLIAFIITIFHWFALYYYNIYIMALISSILQTIIWYFFIKSFYSDYINKSKIMIIVIKIKKIISSYF